MSIRDTIKGAREEAAANGNPFDRSGSSADKDDATTTEKSRQGFSRRSAASSKPSRQAAAGVRMVSANGSTKSKANMTKEEKKAERKRERETQDRRYTVSEMILKETEEYDARRKVWRNLMIASAVLMVIGIGCYVYVTQHVDSAPTWLLAVSFVLMVVFYVLVIVSFVYDWRKIKPLRDQADRRAASMSDKKLRAALNRGHVKK